MRPVVFTKTLAAAVADTIAQSQALAAAGDLTINGASASGGVATLDTQRRVLLTSGGNDSGITFTVYGTNDAKVPISETVTGGNGVGVATLQDFKTVTRIASSGAVATTIEAGTNTVGSTPWAIPSNSTAYPAIGIQCDLVSGAANWSIETTGDDPKAPISIYQNGFDTTLPIPTPFAVTGLTGLAASTQGSITSALLGWRMRSEERRVGKEW